MMNRAATAIYLAALLGAWSSSFPQAMPGPPRPAEGVPPDSQVVVPALPDTIAPVDSVLPMPPAPIARLLKSGCPSSADRRAILESASSSVGEAFLAGPGTHVLRQGGQGMPQYLSLRGGRAGEVVYLLDGVPFSDNQIETQDLNVLPLAGVERVEVLRGGLSSLYGSGAVTGAVEATTLTAMPEVPESEVKAWWGTHETQGASISFSRRVTRRLGVLGAYGNFKSGGWIENTSSDAERFLGKVTCLLGEATQVDFAAYRYRGDFDWPDSCPSVSATSSAKRADDKDLLKASLHTGTNRRLHIDVYRVKTTESLSSRTQRYADNGTFQGVELGVVCLAPDSSVTCLGAGFRRTRIESPVLGDRKSHNIHMYGWRRQCWDRWRLEGSMRFEQNSVFKIQTGLGLAVRYMTGRNMGIFGRFDRSFAFPAFRLLYAGGPIAGRDPRIDPETSLGVELGADWWRAPFFFSVSAFGRRARSIAKVLSDDSCRTYVNPDMAIDMVGLEACLGLRLGPWLRSEVSYSLWRAEDDEGMRPTYLPEQVIALKAGLRRTLSAHVSVGLLLEGWYVSRVESGPGLEPCKIAPACLGETRLPAYEYGLINCYMDIDRATVFVKVRNIGNNVVTTGWGRPSLPSRSYEFGISALLID
jgi:outer membrane cobalamin receptor